MRAVRKLDSLWHGGATSGDIVLVLIIHWKLVDRTTTHLFSVFTGTTTVFYFIHQVNLFRWLRSDKKLAPSSSSSSSSSSPGSTLGSPTHFTPASNGYQRSFFLLFLPSGYYNGVCFLLLQRRCLMWRNPHRFRSWNGPLLLLINNPSTERCITVVTLVDRAEPPSGRERVLWQSGRLPIADVDATGNLDGRTEVDAVTRRPYT